MTTDVKAPVEIAQDVMMCAIGVWFDGWPDRYCEALAINLQFACVMALGAQAARRQTIKALGDFIRDEASIATTELLVRQVYADAERIRTLETLHGVSYETFTPTIGEGPLEP